jgi:hypothetical protein
MGVAWRGVGNVGRWFAGVPIVFATEHVILRLSARAQKHRLKKYFAGIAREADPPSSSGS